MFKKCHTRKRLLQVVSDEINNILCNGIVDRYFFSIIINYDDLVSILVSIFQITVGDNHMNRLFNPLSGFQVFNIMKKMIFLSILSIPFTAMDGIEDKNQKDQTKFDKKVQSKFDVIQRCTDDYVKNKKKVGSTPVRRAAYEGDTECVKSFIDEFGIDVNTHHYKNDKTPLHIAAMMGYVDMVKMLLERDADPNIKSYDLTALHLVAESRRELNSVAKTGRSISRPKDFAEIARLLIKNGAVVDVRNDLDKTALHLAAEFRNAETLKVLLEHGANIYARAYRGTIPEDLINADQGEHKWKCPPTHYRKAEVEIRSMLIRERLKQEQLAKLQRLQINTNFGQ